MNLVKKDSFSLSVETLSDDDAWIFSTMHDYTGLSVREIKSDFYFKENSEFEKNKVFYSFGFHLQKTNFQYFRSFMKFQDLSAIVDGFVKILHLFLSAVFLNYNIFTRDKFLINFLFENGEHNELNQSNEKISNVNYNFRKSFLSHYSKIITTLVILTISISMTEGFLFSIALIKLIIMEAKRILIITITLILIAGKLLRSLVKALILI